MKKKKKPLPTAWEVPDELWQRMEPLILEMDPPKETGRPRMNPRNVVDALIFCIRTGCQWNHIPRVYGDDSTIHRTFQHWVDISLFPHIWALLVEECDELGLPGRLGMASRRQSDGQGASGWRSNWSKSYGSSQTWLEKEPFDGTQRWSRGGRECTRYKIAGSDHGSHCCGPTQTDQSETVAFMLGQSL